MSPGPKVMFSPSTPVKFEVPVRPKRIAFGEWRCGGMISLRIVQAIGDIHGAWRSRGCGASAGIDQHQRAALRGLRRDQLGGAIEQRLDLLLVFPDEGDRLATLHDLAVVVMGDAAVDDPIGRHIVPVDIGMELIQRGLEIVAFSLLALHAHPCTSVAGRLSGRRTNH